MACLATPCLLQTSRVLHLVQWLTSRREAPPDAETVLRAEAERHAIQQRAAALEDADIGQKLRVGRTDCLYLFSASLSNAFVHLLSAFTGDAGKDIATVCRHHDLSTARIFRLCRRVRMACSRKQPHIPMSCQSRTGRRGRRQMRQSTRLRICRRRRPRPSRRSGMRASARGCRHTGSDKS